MSLVTKLATDINGGGGVVNNMIIVTNLSEN
jgi:hypothetical protein